MTDQSVSPDRRPCVLVTGAAGFTGHHMVLQAARAGLRVRATDVGAPARMRAAISVAGSDVSRVMGLHAQIGLAGARGDVGCER